MKQFKKRGCTLCSMQVSSTSPRTSWKGQSSYFHSSRSFRSNN